MRGKPCRAFAFEGRMRVKIAHRDLLRADNASCKY